ncbi:hypothetical protein NQZ68_004972 [Dissostichus eleginoides]|nr:hypothetical protein NQZ68_004972 [Dissostichus eleginoides]
MALINPAGEQSDTAEVDLIEHISKGSGSYYNQITVNAFGALNNNLNHLSTGYNLSEHRASD